MSVSEPELKFQFLWFITNNWMPLVFRYMNFNKSELYHLKDRVNLNPELQEWLQDGNNLSYDSSNTVSAYVKCYLPYYHLERGMLIIRNSKESLEQCFCEIYSYSDKIDKDWFYDCGVIYLNLV